MINELHSYTSIEALSAGITKSLIDKSVFKWSFPEDFDALFTRMSELAFGDDKLKVIAILGRIEAALKKPVFDIAEVVKLAPAAPAIQQLKEGDDRYYAALMIKRLSPDWIFSWAMQNFWAEPAVEKGRLVFLYIIFEHAENFETMLSELGKVGRIFLKEKELNESKVVALLLRILKSIRTLCQQNEFDCNLNVGKVIDDFVGSCFSHFSRDQVKANSRKNLVPEVIGLLLDLVGQRFSLAIEYEHYSALKRIRTWCDDAVWREVCIKEKVMFKLSKTIAEALLILARQNITDGELLMRLKNSVSSESQFADHCRRIAESGLLDDAIIEWLKAGGKKIATKKTISAELEVCKKGELSGVGDLLLRVYEGKASFNALNSSLDDLELFDPSLIPVINDVSNQWKIVSGLVYSLASKQFISLVGNLGQQVDVDRKLFEVAEGFSDDQRNGVVVRPAVLMVVNGKTQVIKKGIVKTV
ncbi:hypothetical protein [Paraglaciecola sp. T6c]|uniref:hypothetical protein n=1 Tax=Pseudoalteromonas atlantica (strain T6c / ATCC BAA-1087) TaxID=3042615 RepID=UPI0002E527C1|nr:hypothetical protein [Paraglaciecola sp. T6c]